MRRISAFALCLISACTPMPRAEVTKSSASDSGAITALPALQAMPSGAPIATRRGNVEIVRDFLDLSFRMESGRALPVMSRFEGHITVGVRGEMPNLAAGIWLSTLAIGFAKCAVLGLWAGGCRVELALDRLSRGAARLGVAARGRFAPLRQRDRSETA